MKAGHKHRKYVSIVENAPTAEILAEKVKDHKEKTQTRRKLQQDDDGEEESEEEAANGGGSDAEVHDADATGDIAPNAFATPS